VLEFQVHLGAHRARDHPVHAVELHALNPLAVNTEQDVPNPHFPALVGRRAGNDLADVDPAASLLIPALHTCVRIQIAFEGSIDIRLYNDAKQATEVRAVWQQHMRSIRDELCVKHSIMVCSACNHNMVFTILRFCCPGEPFTASDDRRSGLLIHAPLDPFLLQKESAYAHPNAGKHSPGQTHAHAANRIAASRSDALHASDRVGVVRSRRGNA